MEDMQAVSWVTGTHTFSPSPLSDAPVTRGTEDQPGTLFQTVSVGCSAEKVAMFSCPWGTPTSVSVLSRPFEKVEVACSCKLG